MPHTQRVKNVQTRALILFFVSNIVNEYNTPLILLSICRQPPFLKTPFIEFQMINLPHSLGCHTPSQTRIAKVRKDPVECS